MKNLKFVFYVLMFLPLLGTMLSLVFLPDQVPAHYGLDGQVTRWGSKYETLVLPVFTIFLGLCMLGFSKISDTQTKAGRDNEKVCIIAGIVSLLIFNILTAFFLYAGFHKTENLFSAFFDMCRWAFSFPVSL